MSGKRLACPKIWHGRRKSGAFSEGCRQMARFPSGEGEVSGKGSSLSLERPWCVRSRYRRRSDLKSSCSFYLIPSAELTKLSEEDSLGVCSLVKGRLKGGTRLTSASGPAAWKREMTARSTQEDSKFVAKMKLPHRDSSALHELASMEGWASWCGRKRRRGW